MIKKALQGALNPYHKFRIMGSRDGALWDAISLFPTFFVFVFYFWNGLAVFFENIEEHCSKRFFLKSPW